MAAPDGAPDRYVHLKDVLDLSSAEQRDEPIPQTRLRALADVPASLDLEDALAQMRSDGSHLARVTDAHGVATGIVFLEDIVEELIGEVQDATWRQRAVA